jgi:iron complex outermembrane receptor protein
VPAPLRFKVVFLAMLTPLAAADPATSRGAADLGQLSLEELMHVEVSTVSRKTEDWWTAAGAIDVVTAEDIRRSGAMSLPDALRLATGVFVGQPNAREWAIGVRGFSVVSGNKVNVQMDGRSLFTPFFSGVLWDAQDTLLEDIERIEVLRGPGGAMWGAFAVNGFIQILTKPAWETQGTLVTAGSGTEGPVFAAVRHGGRLGQKTFYRVYGKYTQFEQGYVPGGRRAGGTVDLAQGGFRTDSRVGADTTFTLQADAYTNKGTPKDRAQVEISGANLVGRWNRSLGVDSDVELTAAYDYTSRLYPAPFDETRHTGSLSGKFRAVRGAHDIQAGVDLLVSRDRIVSGTIVSIEPERRTYSSVGAFVQDAIALVPSRWVTTLGAKLENDEFSGFGVQPTMRIAFTPARRTTWWASLSRAIRPPVRLDVDLVTRVDGTVLFEGNEDLQSEEVTGAEIGWRRKIGARLAVDAVAFVNRYDRIRSYEPRGEAPFPLTFKNSLNARSAGGELTVLLQPAPWLFVKAGYRHLDLTFTKDRGSRDILDAVSESNDPRDVASIAVRADLGKNVEVDATVRHAGSLPNPALAAHTTFDVRLGWRPRRDWSIELIGRNLASPRERDYAAFNSANQEIARSVALRSTWRF